METQKHFPEPQEWLNAGRMPPRIIAHRGLSERFPENTLPAFRAAAASGAELVELDYRATADGILVCAHDDTTGRCIDLVRCPSARDRTVSGSPASEVLRWRARAPSPPSAPAPIPTLEAAVTAILEGGAVPVLERKTGTAAQTLELLRRLDVLPGVCVQAFDWDFLREIRAAAPQLRLAALGKGTFSPSRLKASRTAGIDVVNWDYYGLTDRDVLHLHREGLPVWTWTLNRELEFHDAVSMGVDAITTDSPDRLRAFLERNGPEATG